MVEIPIPSGHHLKGMAIAPNRFVGLTTLNQIESFGLMEPRRVIEAPLAVRNFDARLSVAFDMYAVCDQKRSRVLHLDDYETLIREVHGDASPDFVPLPALGTTAENLIAISDTLSLPYGAPLFVIDGMRQIQARFNLRYKFPESGSWQFPIQLYHGVQEGSVFELYRAISGKGRITISSVREPKFPGDASLRLDAFDLAVDEVIKACGSPLDFNTRWPVPSSKQLASTAQVRSFLAGATFPFFAGDFYEGRLTAEYKRAPSPPPIAPEAIAAAVYLVKSGGYKAFDQRVWQAAGAVCGELAVHEKKWDIGGWLAEGKLDFLSSQADLDNARTEHLASLPDDAPSRVKGLSEGATLEAVFRRIGGGNRKRLTKNPHSLL